MKQSYFMEMTGREQINDPLNKFHHVNIKSE